jgi:type VI secretion system protein ImpH
MADQPSENLSARLQREAQGLNFFGAVALMEEQCAARSKDPFTSGHIRFGLDTSFAFPPGDIASIRRDADGRFFVTPTFMGLANTSSPLPFYFVEYMGQVDAIRREIDKGNELTEVDRGVLAFVDFLTMFNHRAYVLFYQAWKKYACARSLAAAANDPLVRCIAALAGTQPGAAPTPAALRVLAYTGLLAGTPRGPGGLEALVSDFFGGVPVRVREFVPRWAPLADPPRLGDSRLGQTAICGTSVLDYTGKFRVTIGPLNRKKFESFLPSGANFPVVKRLVEAFLADPLDYDIELLMESAASLPVELGRDNARLGETASLGRVEGVYEAKSVALEGRCFQNKA